MKALLTAIFLLAGIPLHADSSAEDAAATVVIFNRNDPEAKALADFYCEARGIPPGRQIPISAPLTEEITREEYDGCIANPIRRELIRRGDWFVTPDMMNRPILYASTVRYAAIIRGIPLKIRQCDDYPGDAGTQPAPYGGVNAASVDSELSVLGLFTPQISGTLNNPLYRERLPASDSASPQNQPLGMLFVSRLDAPTSAAVKSMVLNGITAEKEGLWGWGYLDQRSVGVRGYERGDQWIREAGRLMRSRGIPVLTDDLPETIQPGFPVTDAAAYFGWHEGDINGPFADPAFRFIQGAVAVHLHSYSASTLHDPGKGWTGPLLCHGASASLGNVFEPYLPFTTNLGSFAAALLSGWNLAQSYYAAQPVLSWMSVCVGDPLYRPYAAWYRNVPKEKATTPWRDYRSIILTHEGDVFAAAADLKSRAEEKKESLYLEALGAAQMDAGENTRAEASFREAASLAVDPAIKFRLLLEQARSLEKQGREESAVSLLKENLPHFTQADRQALLRSWIKRIGSPKPSVTPAPTPLPTSQP